MGDVMRHKTDDCVAFNLKKCNILRNYGGPPDTVLKPFTFWNLPEHRGRLPPHPTEIWISCYRMGWKPGQALKPMWRTGHMDRKDGRDRSEKKFFSSIRVEAGDS